MVSCQGKDSPSCSKVNWVHTQLCKMSCHRWWLLGTPHQSIDWLPWESGRPQVHAGGPCRSRPSCSGCSCIYRLLCLFSCIFFPFLWLNLGMSASATAIFLCCFCVTAIFPYIFLPFQLYFSQYSFSFYIGLYVIATFTHLWVLRASPVFGYLIINEKLECGESLGNSLSSCL